MPTLRILSKTSLILFFVSIIAAGSAHAKLFLEFDGNVIKGGAITNGYEGQIEVSSYQLGVGRAISNVGGMNREASNPSFSEMSLSKQLDVSSVPLRKAMVEGNAVGDATLTIVRGSADRVEAILIIELTDVIISSISASSGGDIPSESFSLNYTKVKWTYKCQNEDGPGCTDQTAGWDILANKPF